MLMIEKTKDLQEACERLRSEDFITVDTEFLRDATYWPRLCLIQIASSSEEIIIDPLSEGIDLTAFYEIMADENIIKVFHAARQDIEIFFHFGGVIPHPIVDTQIAAMVCGFGDSVGYEPLVRKVLQKQIDKSSRFTDWSRRPLSDKQLKYAISDVTYLRDIYTHLTTEMDRSGRRAWVDEEMDILTAEETYELHPENSWKRLKLRNTKPKALGILMEIAAWREIQAQERDLPRQRILRDDVLHEIARVAPKEPSELEALRAVPKGFSRSKAAPSLIEAVKTGLAKPKSDIPDLSRPPAPEQNTGPTVELLKVLLKRATEEHGVAAKLLATIADLEKIALSDKADVPALHGWRYQIFGKDALKLKQGKLALALETGPDGPRVKFFEL